VLENFSLSGMLDVMDTWGDLAVDQSPLSDCKADWAFVWQLKLFLNSFHFSASRPTAIELSISAASRAYREK